MKKVIYGLLLAGGLSFSGTAYAGDCVSFSALDRNQDGAISREEASAIPRLASRWSVLDSNSDGAISETEFARYKGPARFPASSGYDRGTGEAWVESGGYGMAIGGTIVGVGLLTPLPLIDEGFGVGIAVAGGVTWLAGQVGSRFHC